MKKKWTFIFLLCILVLAGAAPAKAAEKTDTKIQKTTSFEEFAKTGAKLVEKYQPTSTKSLDSKNSTYASGRLIVQAKDDSFAAGSYGALQVVESPDHIYLMQFASSKAAKKACTQIKGKTGIKYAEPDTYVECESTKGSETLYSKSWGAAKIGADKYAQYLAPSSAGKTIKVAVLDSGVSTHPALSGRLVQGYDFITGDSNYRDPVGHGTHVAGTIVSCTPGLNVKILPIRVVNSLGNGYNFVIGIGIQYAVLNGAKVINMSLGGNHSSYLDDKISYALKKGVTIVAAAGNEKQNTSRICPAHLKKIIVVGAVNSSNRRPSFSNFGKSLDVVAPGVNIISCVPGGSYESMTGTSMAAPHISAIAAMFKLAYPSKSPAKIEKLVKKYTKDLGASGWDKYYGYGIPQLASLVKKKTKN